MRTFDKSDIAPRPSLETSQRYYEFDQMVKCRDPVGGAENSGAAHGMKGREKFFLDRISSDKTMLRIATFFRAADPARLVRMSS
jgi:hypothetical protein